MKPLLSRYVVRFVTTGPSPALLPTLEEVSLRPFDAVEAQKHATSADPWATQWLSSNVAGFGPYEVTSFQSGQGATLSPWAKYYGQPKATNPIKIVAVADPETRF